MKKKLEGDLISIAHRILKIKDKTDINLLCQETRLLYEKLSLLQFIETYFEDSKPTISYTEAKEVLKQFIENDSCSAIVTNLEEQKNDILSKKLIIEGAYSQENTNVNFEPLIGNNTTIKSDKIEILYDELLGIEYNEPDFEKVVNSEEEANYKNEAVIEIDNLIEEKIEHNETVESNNLKNKNSNLIFIDLNEKNEFISYLFDENKFDFNRVLNQIITFNTFKEAKDFIDQMIKPEYNNWEGKEEYENRFLEIIKKKFT